MSARHPLSPRTLARPAAGALAALLVTTLGARAQVPARHAVIATALPAAPATVLIDVDLVSGVGLPLGRFAGDDRPPLALRIDPYDRDVLLAVDQGGGISRMLRLEVRGGAVGSVRVLADVTGTVTDFAVPYPGDVLATLDGPQGGVVQLPRNGGAPVRTLNAPRVAGVSSFDLGVHEVWLGESGTANVPAQLRLFDATTGRVAGPYPLPAIQPPQLTALDELLASLPTHVIGDASGRIWQSVVTQSLVQLPITPALPPGGARSLRVDRGNTGYVLGGAVHPFLLSFDAYDQSPQQFQFVTTALPGDPVAFDVTFRASPQGYFLGTPCSPIGEPPRIYAGGGAPRLGNSRFLLQTRGVPGSPVLLAVGASDQLWLGVPLPLTLPGGGCTLIVAGDALFAGVVGANGLAQQPLPIPNAPALNGAVVFAQWVHALAGGTALASTGALVLHLFP